MNLLHKYVEVTLDEQYARELLEESIFQNAMGWMKKKGKATMSTAKTFFQGLKAELSETKDGMRVLKDLASGKELPPADVDFLKTQIKDLAKGSVLLGLFALPGGGIASTALVKAAKKVGVELMPTGFQKQITEDLNEPVLREYIREMLNEQIDLQTVINDLDNLTADEIMELWNAVVAAHRKKEKEIKAGFKKGDKVEFDHDGETITGTVARRGKKFVSVNVHGYGAPWKRNPSSLRKIS